MKEVIFYLNVYDILYPPSTEYKGWVQIATLNKDKQMISLGYYDFEHLKEKVENVCIPCLDFVVSTCNFLALL